MPQNILTTTQMSQILHEQFKGVEDLGFSAMGVGRIFQPGSRSESNFTQAARTICSNKKLIEGILESCRGIDVKHLERLLFNKGKGCEIAIQNLYSHRTAVNHLMVNVGFSAANMSSLLHKSGAKLNDSIQALIANEGKLQALVESGFSPSNISSTLHNSGQKLGESIPVLISNQKKLQGLLKIGFSANNISSMLSGSGLMLSDSIKALVNNQEILQQFIKLGFSATNISSILNGSGPRLSQAIQALINNFDKLLELKNYGFSARNISYIFHSRGAKLDQAIQALNEKLPLLIPLIESGRFTLSALATKLRKGDSSLDDAIHSNILSGLANEENVAVDFAWDDLLLEAI